MKYTDIRRQQGKWVKQCKYYVRSIEKPQETANDGFCQPLEATDTVGITETLNYFFNDLQFEMNSSEVGEQWLDVRWKDDKGYYQCVPAEVPVIRPLDDDKPDWYKINLGKCRHGILCSTLEGKSWNETLEAINDILKHQTIRDSINYLAQFSMTGEINHEPYDVIQPANASQE